MKLEGGTDGHSLPGDLKMGHLRGIERRQSPLAANSPLFPSLTEQTLGEVEALVGIRQLPLEILDPMFNCLEPLGNIDRG